MDRANPKIVYAAFGNGKFATSGIYKSADQGATWLPTGLQYIYIYGNGDYRYILLSPLLHSNFLSSYHAHILGGQERGCLLMLSILQ